MRRSVHWAILAGLAFAANLAATVRGDEPAMTSQVDPIEWTRPEKPASFREILKADDYKRQFETAASKIDIAALVKANRPAAGNRILTVTPGTPTAQLGLQPGDFLTKLDGEQIWGEWHRRTDQPQTMTYLSKEMDFVWSALVDHRSDRKVQLNPEILYRVAIANYKLDVAAEVLRDYHEPFRGQPDREMLRRLAKMHRARPQAERCQPTPSEQAVNLRRVNLGPVLEPANEWTAKDFKDYLKNRDSFMLSLPSSHFNFLEYKAKPPVRDMEAMLKMTIRFTDNNPTDYAQIVQMWLSDQSTHANVSPVIGDARGPNLLLVGFSGIPNQSVQSMELGHSGIEGTDTFFEDHSVKLDGKQEIEVRLLRIGGEGEIFVNGRRLVYAPIDPQVVDMGFSMKIVGMTVDVKRISINKLEPKVTVRQDASGKILLKAIDANVHGDPLRYQLEEEKNCIGYWANQSDWVDWDVEVDKPGKFDIAVTSSCPDDRVGSKYVVSAGPEKTASVAGVVKATGDWNNFKQEKLGTIEIAKPGRITVAVKVTSKPSWHVMNLRQVELQPAK